MVSAIIAREAKEALSPLGLTRRGRSRVWIDDRGWWLINVEFQPSDWGKGCYLNVGHQHLWVKRDHLVFEDHERPLGGTSFVQFRGDEVEFASAVSQASRVAADAVLRRRSAHGEAKKALRRVADSRDDLNGGIAAAVLGKGKLAEKRLRGLVHPAYQDQAAQFMGLDQDQADTLARQSVTITRQLLRLPAEWSDWST